jgi:hypothetical protein
MHKVEQNCTHTQKKPTNCPKFKCNTVSVKACMCSCGCFLIKGKEREKKKKSQETVLRMVSAAVDCLPAAVSLLLLEALFMQISGVSLALTWPCRVCLLRVLLCANRYYKLSPFQAHWGRWHCTCFLRPACLFTVHMESGSFPLSCGVFLPLPLSQAFPLLVTGHAPPTPAGPAYLFTVLGRIPFPQSSALSAPHHLSCVSSLFLLLITQFLFFPRGEGKTVWGLGWSGLGSSVGVLQYH